MKEIGGPSEVAPIRRLLLKRPEDAFVDERCIEAQWRDLHFTARPDLKRAAAEHERFVGLLRGPETELLFLPRDDAAGLDSIYVRDAGVVADPGAIRSNIGKSPPRGAP